MYSFVAMWGKREQFRQQELLLFFPIASNQILYDRFYRIIHTDRLLSQLNIFTKQRYQALLHFF